MKSLEFGKACRWKALKSYLNHKISLLTLMSPGKSLAVTKYLTRRKNREDLVNKQKGGTFPAFYPRLISFLEFLGTFILAQFSKMSSFEIGTTVQHTNPDCPAIGGVNGQITWMDVSKTFCDVIFDLPPVEVIKHPHLNEHYYNRINDPVRLPTRLLKQVE